MAEVMELRMELIFPRSTLARLTPSVVVGVLWRVTAIGDSGVGAEAGGVVLGDFIVVSGRLSFDGTPTLVVLETAGDAFPVFSSTGESNIIQVYSFIHASNQITNMAPWGTPLKRVGLFH